jgi:4-diphosphocytidyl-2C-methyl-D-erythritol kinase
MPTCKTFEELIFMIGQIDNDFEKVHFNTITELEEIKRTLVNAGAAITRMSGSGPSMFGLFYDKPDEGYLDTLTGRGWNISIVHPIPCPLESH